MKILKFLGIVILLSSIQSMAQTDNPFGKGSTIVDGSASFKSQGGEMRGDTRNSIISVSSSYLFFIIPHFCIGCNLGYQHSDWNHSKTTIINLGPEIRYYFGKDAKKLHPFISGSYNFLRLVGEHYDSYVTFAGGAVYMINPYVGLFGSVYYMLESRKEEDSEKRVSGNTSGVQFGFIIFMH